MGGQHWRRGTHLRGYCALRGVDLRAGTRTNRAVRTTLVGCGLELSLVCCVSEDHPRTDTVGFGQAWALGKRAAMYILSGQELCRSLNARASEPFSCEMGT